MVELSIGMPLLGGVLIGLAAAGLLLLTGQVAGVSGIIGGLLEPKSASKSWRVAFVAGLLVGGSLLALLMPETLASSVSRPWPLVIVAGLLVGFGTQMGSGCTSGHGICGISRFSPRSIVATITFMAAGAVTVVLMRLFMG